jgi:hypothetical protein
MNLQEFSSGTPASKAWLDIVANSGNFAALAINGNAVAAGNAVLLGSAGGVSLVADGVGPTLETKGLTAGVGITLTPSGTDVTIDATGGPFLPLSGGDVTGPIDAIALPLDLGTVTATAVNIGQVGVVTSISGAPPSLGKYSTLQPTIQGGVLTVQPLIANSGVGSLIYPANSTYPGTVVRYRLSGITNNVTPETQTINFEINGAPALQIVWAPGTVVNQLFTISGVLAVQSSDSFADMTVACIDGAVPPASTSGLPVWDPTVANTLSASVQYSAITSGGAISFSMFETLFD